MPVLLPIAFAKCTAYVSMLFYGICAINKHYYYYYLSGLQADLCERRHKATSSNGIDENLTKEDCD